MVAIRFDSCEKLLAEVRFDSVYPVGGTEGSSPSRSVFSSPLGTNVPIPKNQGGIEKWTAIIVAVGVL